MTTTPDPDYAAQIHAFAPIVREFVQLLDTSDNVDDIVFALDELLPRLYAAGTRLAVAAPEAVYSEPSDAPLDSEADPEEEAELGAALADTLMELFGDEDGYHVLEYVDAGLQNYDIEERSLSSDLALMHAVLKEQLAIYDLAAAEYIEESGRGWLQSFEGIWGTQLPFLLAAMNHRIYGSLTNEEVEESEEPGTA